MRPKALKPAIHGHDFEGSGEYQTFGYGTFARVPLEKCRWCGWPFDEHPNHPTRRDNPHIIAVYLNERRNCLWYWGRAWGKKMNRGLNASAARETAHV